MNQKKVKLAELEREAAANRALFEQFLSRAKETTAQTGLEKADARIISAALVPVKPSYPRPMLVLLVAAMGGLGLGLALALIAENSQQSGSSAFQPHRSPSSPPVPPVSPPMPPSRQPCN